MQHFDILIVGSGPAGQQAAIQASALGKSVGIIERKPRIGGAGLQTGTIPSKALREIAYLASRQGQRGMREALSTGWQSDSRLLGEAIRKKDMVIAQQESVILSRLMTSGVSLIPGEAHFIDEHTFDVKALQGEAARYSADVIVLATGSRPRRPAWVPFDKKTVLDSTSILNLSALPASLTVVGGGVIACEFASFYAALGTKVTIVDSHEQILSYLGVDIVEALSDAMRMMGIEFLMQCRVKDVLHDQGKVRASLDNGSEMVSDCLLFAQGREPNYEHLDIECAGLAAEDQGWIPVNEHFQTRKAHIYAVGDLIGRPALASTGMEQGRLAVQHAFGTVEPKQSRQLPMAIYTIPEVSYVGKTERQLRSEGADYVIGRGYFRDSARGQIIGEQSGLLKMLVERKTRHILGVHIVGESASELVHIGQLIMNLGGSVDDLVENVFNYPTLAECYKIAAQECVRSLQS